MTMTLRRCDSLPTRLRDPVATDPAPKPTPNQIPDSNTVPNFREGSAREEVIATWKSLYTDIKNIKNGFPANDLPNHGTAEKESITHNFIPAFPCNNKNVPRRITYDNRQRVIPRVAERCSSFSLEAGQVNSAELGVSRARRRTLLQRLLSWRTPECDCSQRCPRPYRREELCACCANHVTKPAKCNKYAERGRSKSVGYEAAREVTRFRRLVLCVKRSREGLSIDCIIRIFSQSIDESSLSLLKCCGVLGVRVLVRRSERRRRRLSALELP